MNKKFLSALFLGSIIAAGGTFTACSDYDDDIDSLNQRVDAVEQAVTDLQNAIKGGSMITNVQSTDKGVVVTLSNGSSIELTNGLDGAAGAPGFFHAPFPPVCLPECLPSVIFSISFLLLFQYFSLSLPKMLRGGNTPL